MPELPEVEVTRLQIAEPLADAQILHLQMGKPLRWPLGIAAEALTGRTVQSVRRRGKYLLLHLDRGILLLHLGMSGSLRLLPTDLPLAPGPHDHVCLRTSRTVLVLNDPRRFGALVYADGPDDPVLHKLLGHLGVEPLEPDFTPKRFLAALAARRVAIKPLLLAGDVVVGVGNIYASEALFMARIDPAAPAHTLDAAAVRRLHRAIVEVLGQAVDLGGSTLRNYRGPDGQAGAFQAQAWVYGRAGAPCRRCASLVVDWVQGQRRTFACPRCQGLAR